MTHHLAIYAGSIALLLGAGTLALSEPTGSSTMGSGSSQPSQPVVPDKKTDLTGGKSGVPQEYADTPVRQGKLEEVKDSQYANATVYSTSGEEIGKIQQVLKDTKTGDIEYVVFVGKESKRPQPIRWSLFKPKGDKLQLTMQKEEIQNPVPMSSSKDQSPDIKEYMDRINAVRNDPTVKGQQQPGVPGQYKDGTVGGWGEESVSQGGPSGPSILPPAQKAPQLEGDHPSSKH
jgi:sporulation protein YlmC with PRC-barrel domain